MEENTQSEKEILQVNKDLLRSNVDYIILRSLEDGDNYAYEILKEITQKTEKNFIIKQATLYNGLKRLEKDGKISSYLGEESEGGQRRYYTLTDDGKKCLNEQKSMWAVTRTIMDKLLTDEMVDLSEIEVNAEIKPLTKRTRNERKIDVSSNIDLQQRPTSFDPQLEDEGDVLLNQIELPSSAEYLNIIKNNEERLMAENNRKEADAEAFYQTKQEIKYEDKQNYFISQQDDEDFKEEKRETAAEEDKRPMFTSYFDFLESKEVDTQTNQHSLEYNEKKEAENNQLETALKKEFEIEEDSADVFDSDLNKTETLLQSETNIEESFDLEAKVDELTDKYVLSDTFNLEEEKNEQLDRQFEKINNNEINYRSALENLYEREDCEFKEEEPTATADTYDEGELPPSLPLLKANLFRKGFKLRIYNKENATAYYSLNFYHKNKLLRDCSIICFGVFIIELLISFFAFGSITPLNPIVVGVLGALSVLFPIGFFLLHYYHPQKRKRAEFDYKLAILNSIMFVLCGIVVVTLFAFFVFNADIGNVQTLVKTLILPILFLFDVPLFITIFYLLYRTKRYHIK